MVHLNFVCTQDRQVTQPPWSLITFARCGGLKAFKALESCSLLLGQEMDPQANFLV